MYMGPVYGLLRTKELETFIGDIEAHEQTPIVLK